MAIFGGKRRKDFSDDPPIADVSEDGNIYREGEKDGGKTAIHGSKVIGRFPTAGEAAHAEEIDRAVEGD